MRKLVVRIATLIIARLPKIMRLWVMHKAYRLGYKLNSLMIDGYLEKGDVVGYCGEIGRRDKLVYTYNRFLEEEEA